MPRCSRSRRSVEAPTDSGGAVDRRCAPIAGANSTSTRPRLRSQVFMGSPGRTGRPALSSVVYRIPRATIVRPGTSERGVRRARRLGQRCLRSLRALRPDVAGPASGGLLTATDLLDLRIALGDQALPLAAELRGG